MVVGLAEFSEWSQKLSKLYDDADLILEGLDGLGLYQAGGHLSLAMEAMLQAHRARLTRD
ncbi:MAG TPA: hypothetical protein VN231_07835 [Allosphingosinicella sp.]|nr:hypothetical protein [Allosphingosinicella sp.]